MTTKIVPSVVCLIVAIFFFAIAQDVFSHGYYFVMDVVDAWHR